MSYWNYRIIRKHHKKTGISTSHIHEVYYNDEHQIDGWSEKAVSPMGESLAELQRDIELFLKAFKKPILFEK